jgi:RHS repeat-associated protein
LAYWEGDEAGYLQNDALGSVVGATAADGREPDDLMGYGDYGELEGSEDALPTDDGFTGYEYDTYTGLNYARNRYYDLATGTFLTVDPHPVDYKNVLGLNQYAYVDLNPINTIDPLGLFSLKGVFNSAKSAVREIAHRVLSPRPKPQTKPRPSLIGLVVSGAKAVLRGVKGRCCERSASNHTSRVVQKTSLWGRSGSSCGKEKREIISKDSISREEFECYEVKENIEDYTNDLHNTDDAIADKEKEIDDKWEDLYELIAWDFTVAGIGGLLAVVGGVTAVASCLATPVSGPAAPAIAVACVGGLVGAAGGKVLAVFAIGKAAYDWFDIRGDIRELERELGELETDRSDQLGKCNSELNQFRTLKCTRHGYSESSFWCI